MKIIGKSNFDNEMVNDILICENIRKPFGEPIIKFLNESFCNDHSVYYYKLVEDYYKLYIFKP